MEKDSDNNKKNVLTIPDIKILDKDLLKEVPYFNDTTVVDETDKLKKREAIIYEIISCLQIMINISSNTNQKQILTILEKIKK